MENINNLNSTLFDIYQKHILRTVPQNIHFQERVAMMALGLAGEAGELVNILKKELFHKHPSNPEKIKDEIGDVLWYITALASAYDLKMSDVVSFNIEKLAKRYPDGFSYERSINRPEP